MHNRFSCLVLIFFMVASCAQNRSQEIKIERDIHITPANAFTGLSLDSIQLAQYSERERLDDSVSLLLENFYNSRNYQLAWFTEDGIAEQTQAFYTLHQQYIQEFRDSSLLLPTHLQNELDRLMFRDTLIRESSVPLMELELQLTRYFFSYVSLAYTGSVDPEILQWHIPRKKVDALALLDSLVRNNGKNLEQWEPTNRQYKLLKRAMVRLYEIEKENNWGLVYPDEAQVLRIGDSSAFIKDIKRKLGLAGDFGLADSTIHFNSELEKAVIQYQGRMGLKQDGVIGKRVVHELNVPIKKRIEQLLINLERMRWMPNLPEGNGILVNIPQYKLHVFEKGEIVMDMNIVVGNAATQTVIFSDEIKYVVFSPYWNVPRSIVRSEIYPAMKGNPNYLAQKNMEQTGFSNGLPIVRQKPGNSNALGRVKFIFPNSYNIYLHDTPSRNLFSEERRAFSHGCIRIQKPFELAEYLLREDAEWPSEKIYQAMRKNSEKWVSLEKTVPVFISYFTAWVDRNGLLNFREDIYGHDKKMADRLFHHTLAKN